MGDATRTSLTTRLVYTGIGLALGAVGVGWHGQPTNGAIERAILFRSPSHAGATIVLQAVRRNWMHEIFGSSTSRFLVTATLTQPDGVVVEQCFGIEPGLADTALALGPYADWRCRYPF